MSRYLFVVPPFVGHVTPAVGVARELRDRGHAVAWVAHQDVVGGMLGEDAHVYPAGDHFLAEVVQHLPERSRLKGLAALQFLWEKVLVPLAVDMVDPVRAAVDDHGPDVLVTDPHAFAGGIVATERDLPWATSASTSAELLDPLAGLGKVRAWRQRLFARMCAEVGVPSLGAMGFDPRYSPHLVVVYSTPAFLGDVDDRPGEVAYVGPSLPQWSQSVPFRWEWLDRHRTNVFVSMGTVSPESGGRFLNTVLDAVAGKDYGVVMMGQVLGRRETPDNVVVEPFVPQMALLRRVQAVVSHAGYNTVVEALSCGVPLVCAPIRDDQPANADRVVQAGAGRRISFWRGTPAQVAQAIDAVLTDPSYRRATRHIADSFATAGGASAAADHLEELVGASRISTLT